MRGCCRRGFFLRKTNSDGVVCRHKARLVVKGYLQEEVENTFAPVVGFNTVLTVLTAAIRKGMVIQQMDVKTAFLHGDIDDDVYVSPPRGLDICRSGEVLRLRKGLYGLKQAPSLWDDKWKRVMDAMGFKPLLSDECVFVKKGCSVATVCR